MNASATIERTQAEEQIAKTSLSMIFATLGTPAKYEESERQAHLSEINRLKRSKIEARRHRLKKDAELAEAHATIVQLVSLVG